MENGGKPQKIYAHRSSLDDRINNFGIIIIIITKYVVCYVMVKHPVHRRQYRQVRLVVIKKKQMAFHCINGKYPLTVAKAKCQTGLFGFTYSEYSYTNVLTVPRNVSLEFV